MQVKLVEGDSAGTVTALYVRHLSLSLSYIYRIVLEMTWEVEIYKKMMSRWHQKGLTMMN